MGVGGWGWARPPRHRVREGNNGIEPSRMHAVSATVCQALSLGGPPDRAVTNMHHEGLVRVRKNGL